MTHGNGKRSALGLRYRTPSSLLRLVEAGEEARKKPSLRIAGLFAGVGGLELGFQRAGHEALMLCEIDEPAKAVLHARFPSVPLEHDVCALKSLPRDVDLVAAGFPCQDLSQAGKTAGIEGARSGLVGEVFRLLEKKRTPWVLLENVPFMLRLSKGRALEVIVSALESLGYRWAYRVVDTRAFGLPQRRERVFLLASLDDDPRTVLLADEAGEPTPVAWKPHRTSFGFYWTEGIRGLGAAVDAVPTLKGGSTIGIPSSPAILLPNGRVVTRCSSAGSAMSRSVPRSLQRGSGARFVRYAGIFPRRAARPSESSSHSGRCLQAELRVVRRPAPPATSRRSSSGA